MAVRPGYKQTEVGVIPDEWALNNISSVSDMITVGFVGSMTHLFTKMGVPLLRGQDVKPNKLILSNTEFISIDTHKLWKKSALECGDVVIVRVGASAGMACVIPSGIGHANAASLVVVRPSTNKLSAVFLSQLINSKFGEKQIESLLVGGAQPVINTSTAANFKLALPPIGEQRDIATALSDVDGLLAKLDQFIAKKRDLKQATMQQLLTGQTRLPGFSGEWEVKHVEEFGEIVTGGTPRTNVKEYWGDGFPWITPTDISIGRDMCSSERSITRLGLNSIRPLPKNTVLVTCIASIGKNAILKVEGACNQQINAVVPNEDHCSEFLYFLFEASKKYLQANAGTTATSIISKATFSKLVFPVPVLPEQTAIATVLSDMDTELSGLHPLL